MHFYLFDLLVEYAYDALSRRLHKISSSALKAIYQWRRN